MRDLTKIQIYVRDRNQIVKEEIGDLIFFDKYSGQFAYWKLIEKEKGFEPVLVSGRLSKTSPVKMIAIDGELIGDMDDVEQK